jgi:hypothetical protein
MKFYHATSSLFLASIREYGLGGRRPIIDWRAKSLASEMLQFLRQNVSSGEHGVLSALEVCVSDVPLFQHGQVYLTISPKEALAFANHNRFGSELLSYIARGMEILQYHEYEAAKEWRTRYPDIFIALNAHQIRPVVLLLELQKDKILDEWGIEIEEECWSDLLENWEIATEYYKSFETAFRLKPEVCIPWSEIVIYSDRMAP